MSSGRCFKCVEFEDTATAVAWNPVHHILAVAAASKLYFIDPGLEKKVAGSEPVEGIYIHMYV